MHYLFYKIVYRLIVCQFFFNNQSRIQSANSGALRTIDSISAYSSIIFTLAYLHLLYLVINYIFRLCIGVIRMYSLQIRQPP